MLYRRFNLSFSKKLNTTNVADIPNLAARLSIKESYIFWAFLLVFSVTFIAVLFQINQSFLVETPIDGGGFTEGMVGRPGFINPVLAISDTDKDISMLVYSGLLRPSSDGGFIKDLAEDYSISEDGLTYRVNIKRDAFWHDGESVKADDIIFTINKIKDPFLKSPLLSNIFKFTLAPISSH